MFTEYFDRQAKVVAWEHSSPFDPSDFETHCKLIEELANDRSRAANAIVVFHVQSGAPGPSAKDRREIFEAMQRLPSTLRGILITTNPLAAGAATALRWLGLTKVEVFTFGTWDQACKSDHFNASERERIRVGQKLIENASSRSRVG